MANCAVTSSHCGTPSPVWTAWFLRSSLPPDFAREYTFQQFKSFKPFKPSAGKVILTSWALPSALAPSFLDSLPPFAFPRTSAFPSASLLGSPSGLPDFDPQNPFYLRTRKPRMPAQRLLPNVVDVSSIAPFGL